MTKPLSNGSSEATETTNTTGVMTPILTFEAEDQMLLEVDNFAEGEYGIPIIADMRDSNDDKLPQDTSLSIQYEAHNMDDAITVSFVQSNISTWNQLTLQEQQNSEYKNNVRVELKKPTLTVPKPDLFHISVDSSEEIDWSNSELHIGKNHVSERSQR